MHSVSCEQNKMKNSTLPLLLFYQTVHATSRQILDSVFQQPLLHALAVLLITNFYLD